LRGVTRGPPHVHDEHDEKQTMRVKSVFTCNEFNSFYRFLHPATARWEELTPMNVGPVFRLSDFWQVNRLHSDCKTYLLGFQLEHHVSCLARSEVAHRQSTTMTYVKVALDIADEYGETDADTFHKDLRNKATEVLNMLDATLEALILIQRYTLDYPTPPGAGATLYQDAVEKLSRNVTALREIDADALHKTDSLLLLDLFKAVRRRQEEERRMELDDNSEFESETVANFMHYQFPR
jgi:hypothetical protein